MGSILHTKIMTFNRARITFTNCRSNDVYFLSYFKTINTQFHTNLIICVIAVANTKLCHYVAGFNLRLSKVASLGFRYARRFALTCSNLHGTISIIHHSLNLCDSVRLCLNNSYWDRLPFFRKNTCHTAFAANKTH